MKKQIIISSYDSLNNPYYGGGGAIAIHELARRLSNKYNVTIITNRYPGSKDKIIDGVEYHYIGISITPLIDQAWYHFASAIKASQIRRGILFESFTPPVVTGLIPLVSKIPVIGVAHMLPGIDSQRKYSLPFTTLEKLGLRNYKQIIATTSVFSDIIKNYAPKTLTYTIPNGVNQIKVKPRKPLHYLFIGRIDINQKGIDSLIEAIGIIREEGDSTALVIAGPSRQKQRHWLESHISKISHIYYLHGVKGRKKYNLFSKAKAVIIPSRFETFSLVAAEALSAGIPLITSDIAGLKWIPSNSRFIFKTHNGKQLAETIKYFNNNTELQKRKVKNGLKYVKKLNWKKITDQYEQLIEKNYEK